MQPDSFDAPDKSLDCTSLEPQDSKLYPTRSKLSKKSKKGELPFEFQVALTQEVGKNPAWHNLASQMKKKSKKGINNRHAGYYYP